MSHGISFFSIPPTQTRFNIYGWNVRPSEWFKVPDVEMVPRRFSDPAKVMSFFTFYVPLVFFRVPMSRENTESYPLGRRACSTIYFFPFRKLVWKIFLLVYLRRFGSFDVDCHRIQNIQTKILCLCTFLLNGILEWIVLGVSTETVFDAT